jgi:hypothetical protein
MSDNGRTIYFEDLEGNEENEFIFDVSEEDKKEELPTAGDLYDKLVAEWNQLICHCKTKDYSPKDVLDIIKAYEKIEKIVNKG